MFMDVRKKEMKNGLVVVTEAMPHLRSVSLGVWIRCGSRLEDANNTGMSHFIEHLLFKGTRKRSAARIAEATDSIGGHLDAFTEKEYVGFYAKVMDEHLPLAFDLVSDLVLHPAFPSVEIKRERNVIFEEINMVEDSPQELVLDLFMERFWKEHPLGRPILGTKKSVAQLTRSGVKEFFENHYNPCNMIVAVAGNIRHRHVHGLAERYFSHLKPGAAADPGLPPQVHAGCLIRHKAHLEQTHLCLGTVSPSILSEDRYCMHLLSNILGGGMSSRLFQNVRERRGLVYSIHSMLNLYRDAGTLIVYAGAAPDKASHVVHLILKEFRALREKLVSPRELKRAKDYIKGAILLSLESSSSRMTQLAQQLIYHDRLYSLEEVLSAVERVTARDIRNLANNMFDNAALSLTALSGRNGQDLKNAALRV